MPTNRLEAFSDGVLARRAIASAGWEAWLSMAVYILVALIWIVPDRRIERVLA